MDISYCVNEMDTNGEIREKEVFESKKKAIDRAVELTETSEWDIIDVEKQIDTFNPPLKKRVFEDIKRFKVWLPKPL